MPIPYYPLDGVVINSPFQGLVVESLLSEFEAQGSTETVSSILITAIRQLKHTADFKKQSTNPKIKIEKNSSDAGEVFSALKKEINELSRGRSEIPWKVGGLVLVVDLKSNGEEISRQNLQYLNDDYTRDFRSYSPIYKNGAAQNYPLKYWYLTIIFKSDDVKNQTLIADFNNDQLTKFKRLLLDDPFIQQESWKSITDCDEQKSFLESQLNTLTLENKSFLEQTNNYQQSLLEKNADIDAIRSESAAKAKADYEALSAECNEYYQKTFAEREISFNSEIQRLKDQIESLNLDNKTLLEKNRTQEQQVEAVKIDFENQKREFIAQSEQRIKSLENDCNEFYAGLLVERDKTIENNAVEVQSLQRNHQSQIEGLTASYNQELERLRSEYQSHYEQLLSVGTTGKNQETRLLSSIIEQQKQDIAALEQRHQTELSAANEGATLQQRQHDVATMKKLENLESRNKITERALQQQKQLADSLTARLQASQEQHAEYEAELANLKSIIAESRDEKLSAFREHEAKMAECQATLDIIMGENKKKSVEIEKFSFQKQCPNLLSECKRDKEILQAQVQELTQQLIEISAANKKFALYAEKNENDRSSLLAQIQALQASEASLITPSQHQAELAVLQEKVDKCTAYTEDLLQLNEDSTFTIRDLKKQINALTSLQNMKPVQEPTQSIDRVRTTLPDRSEEITNLQLDLDQCIRSTKTALEKHQNAMEALRNQSTEQTQALIQEQTELADRLKSTSQDLERVKLQYAKLSEQHTTLKQEYEQVYQDKTYIWKDRYNNAEMEIADLKKQLEQANKDLDSLQSQVLKCEDQVQETSDTWKEQSKIAFEQLETQHAAELKEIEKAFATCKQTTSDLEARLSSLNQQLSGNPSDEARGLSMLNETLASQLSNCKVDLRNDENRFAEHKKKQLETETNLKQYYKELIENYKNDIDNLKSNIVECENKTSACLTAK